MPSFKFYPLILVLLLKEWKYPLLRLLKITLQILYYSMSSLPQAEYLILVTGSSHDLFLLPSLNAISNYPSPSAYSL